MGTSDPCGPRRKKQGKITDGWMEFYWTNKIIFKNWTCSKTAAMTATLKFVSLKLAVS